MSAVHLAALRRLPKFAQIGDDGALSATAVVKQTDWGMKPYSALFGALKVHEDVEVVLDGHL